MYIFCPESEFLGGMVTSIFGARNIQDEQGISCGAQKEKSLWNRVKNTQEPTERVSTGPKWGNLKATKRMITKNRICLSVKTL